MKRFCLILLVIGMLIATPLAVRAETGHCFCAEHLNGTAPYTPGDLDKDGRITAIDALWILKMATRLPVAFTSGELCGAPEVTDVTGNDKIDASDALAVLKYAVGKIDGFDRQVVWPAPAEAPTEYI